MAVTAPITGDLAELFPDLVYVAPRTGTDGGMGSLAYGTLVARPARVSEKVVTVRDSHGQERVSRVQVSFGGAFGVKVTDTYLLPSRYDPRSPKAVAVECYSDENGPHHDKAYF